MIRRTLKETIEKLGFECVGNDYIADFQCGFTGNALTCIVKDDEDEKGTPTVKFHFYNVCGDLTGVSTLDQVIFSIDSGDLIKLPRKSDKKYVSEYNVIIKVPVDMNEISKRKYLECIEYCGNNGEMDIVELYGRHKFNNTVSELFKVVGFEIEEMECIGVQEVKIK